MTKNISEIVYSDLDMNFVMHPDTNDVMILKNANAIKKSVKQIVLLNRFERPYQPYLYGGILDALFENFTPILVLQLKERIRNVIVNEEPRAEVLEINVSEETELDRNGIKIEIYFKPINMNTRERVDIFLERIR